MLAIEGDGGVDVVDDVANLYSGHEGHSFFLGMIRSCRLRCPLSFHGPRDSAWSLVIPGRGFEQFDGVARWVLEQDLSDSNSAGLIIAEVHTGGAQGFDCLVEIRDLDQDTIPSSGRW